ncbi:hypothetical protein BpHYR1_005233 [Brachionus plicatilis]|uniref:Transmembrane protein n=1 Tax=Brachionus plicatilis TaxID=10195 RepID=A0A3M7SAI0_BRAPC|nr:hypothetical protein BpHYR1_005233 [Brachionus plicatilis]
MYPRILNNLLMKKIKKKNRDLISFNLFLYVSTCVFSGCMIYQKISQEKTTFNISQKFLGQKKIQILHVDHLQTFSKNQRVQVSMVGFFSQPFGSMIDSIEGGNVGQEGLGGTNVASCLVLSDVLLSGL